MIYSPNSPSKLGSLVGDSYHVSSKTSRFSIGLAFFFVDGCPWPLPAPYVSFPLPFFFLIFFVASTSFRWSQGGQLTGNTVGGFHKWDAQNGEFIEENPTNMDDLFGGTKKITSHILTLTPVVGAWKMHVGPLFYMNEHESTRAPKGRLCLLLSVEGQPGDCELGP